MYNLYNLFGFFVAGVVQGLLLALCSSALVEESSFGALFVLRDPCSAGSKARAPAPILAL